MAGEDHGIARVVSARYWLVRLVCLMLPASVVFGTRAVGEGRLRQSFSVERETPVVRVVAPGAGMDGVEAMPVQSAAMRGRGRRRHADFPE